MLLPAAAGETKIMTEYCAFAQAPSSSRVRRAVAFSISRVTRYALVLASLRHASISTRSPSLYSLFSSCAWYLLDRVTTLP